MSPITNFIFLTTAALCSLVGAITTAMFAMRSFKEADPADKEDWAHHIAWGVMLVICTIILLGFFALCQFHAINDLR